MVHALDFGRTLGEGSSAREGRALKLIEKSRQGRQAMGRTSDDVTSAFMGAVTAELQTFVFANVHRRLYFLASFFASSLASPATFFASSAFFCRICLISEIAAKRKGNGRGERRGRRRSQQKLGAR